ncbi:hypothetical protein Droror1_Dr00024793 [Drosera rotundifolia]
MRDFPSCFGENAVQISDSSSSSNGNKTAQNLVTCVYQCRLRGWSCSITLTWSKNLMGQPGFSVGIDDSSNHTLCKVEIKPWLFSKKKGSKCIELDDLIKVDVYWDLSDARFGSGPEPLDRFYVAIVSNKQLMLLLGDLKKEAIKKTNATPSLSNAALVAKREHIFGRRAFYTKTRFCDDGPLHDIMIECDTVGTNDPCLVVRLDTKNVMRVKCLRWKFRGNHTILVDGLPVDVFWDVYNWLFGTSPGSAVFMFRTSLSAEKLWASQPVSDLSALNWSHSQRFREPQFHHPGFSLFLYAWKQV